MASQIDGLALGSVAIGGLFIYAGVKGISVPAALRSLITGKSPATLPQANPITGASGGTSSGSGGTGGSGGSITSSNKENQALARLMAAGYGWAATKEWTDLAYLWTRESDFSNTAYNPSGAYGIAQALGHAGAGESATGPRSVGSGTPGVNNAYGSQYGLSSAHARDANAGHPEWQIAWGLGYIKATYGDPAAAWAHEQSNGWY